MDRAEARFGARHSVAAQQAEAKTEPRERGESATGSANGRALAPPVRDESIQPGRCVYCDQRCEANAIAHGYCLDEHARDEPPDRC